MYRIYKTRKNVFEKTKIYKNYMYLYNNIRKGYFKITSFYKTMLDFHLIYSLHLRNF